METCVRCGAELGVGRFCLNCGHLIGAPVPPSTRSEVEPPPTAAAPPSPAPAPPGPPRGEWNPAEDLLPFDDDTRQGGGGTGISGWAMLGWVVGAALLVGLVFVLLRAFGVDGGSGAQDSDTDPAAAQESRADAASVEAAAEAAPQTVGKAADVARAATFVVPATAPATTDFDGRLVSYVPAQMHDGLPATTWRMAGDGTGAVITITLRRPTVVSRVGLINGYAKQISGVDWYPNNRRILSVRWSFDNGSSILQTLEERPDLQQIELPPGLTSTVTLTISSVTAPGAGSLGRDYTAISEVAITGRRAR